MKIGDVLINWYRKNKRDLPWRNTREPYLIWVSEIIFQQTRIIQGIQYYNRFIERFPDLSSLASAKIDDVLKVWQGLGYYSRARNMHETAKNIVSAYKGIFPGNAIGLLKLKGIGDYTAAAIASISYNEKIPVVDGNVIRLISRLNGLADAISIDMLKKEIAEIAFKYMSKHLPGEFNQAMMDFGAMQCKPGKPDCESCPLKKYCFAYINNMVDEIPAQKKQKTVRNRYFYYGVIINKNKVIVKKRDKNDIWKGLYDFPMIETEKKVTISALKKLEQFKSLFGDKILSVKEMDKEVKHILSHQIIYAKFIEIKYKNTFHIKLQGTENVTVEKLKTLPVSRLLERFIESEFKN